MRKPVGEYFARFFALSASEYRYIPSLSAAKIITKSLARRYLAVLTERIFARGEEKDAGNTPVFANLLTMHGQKDADQNLVYSYRLWYTIKSGACT